MAEFSVWLIETTIVVTMLVGVVMLLRRPVARLANVRWAYLLWSVPALVLILRLLPEPARAVTAGIADAAGLGGLTPSVGSGWMSASVAGTLLVIWILGFAVSVGRLIVEYLRLRRLVLEESESLRAEEQRRLTRYCDRMGIFPAVDCLETSSLAMPALMGLFKPTLLLPRGFLSTCDEPELVIRHELVHFQRRDPLFNALAAFLRCAFWFNPLVHIAERRYRDDQEVACDRAVLADAPVDQRYGYGRALVGAVSPRAGLLTGFVATEPALKRRVRWLAHHRVDYRREAAGSMMILALALGGIAFGVEAPAVPIDWLSPLTFPLQLPGGCGG